MPNRQIAGKIPNGKVLPVGGRDYNVLDMLLEPLIHVCQYTGNRIVLRTTRKNIEKYWHLTEDSNGHRSYTQ